MKFTPEVVAALEVLRAAAENDFERHRINVLERDLHEPPAPEIIDETHQKFNGVVYKKNPAGHFSRGNSIHRDVWQYYHGEISEGYQIHHVDEDKGNNTIENLQCLTTAEHREIHAPEKIPTRKHFFTCENCGKVYFARDTGNNRFCSLQCNHEFHSEEKVCPVCGEKFKTSKYDPKTFCSRQCASRAKAINAIETRTCPVCGEKFSVKKGEKKQFCSHSCANKANCKKRLQKTD